MVKWITFVLSVLGLLVAAYVVSTADAGRPAPAPPAAPPSVNPFARGVASTGLVEASTRNIALGAPEGGIVQEVFVQVGDAVEPGQPVFRLDARLLEADLLRAAAAKASAQARLAQMAAQPRPEEVPALVAALDRARARLEDEEDKLSEAMRAEAGAAMSRNEINRRRFAVAVARADVQQAEADLALLRAGAWAPTLAVAQNEVHQADAEIRAIGLRLERLTVRSPVRGSVLKRGVEPGQYLAPGAGAEAAIFVGDLTTLHVRARVDEEDAPLLRPGAAGVARVRGVAAENVPLEMLRIEPLALPKTNLTGANLERVDTRVVEVVFRIPKLPRAPIFPGQLVDVFIQTDPSGPGEADTPPAPG